MIRRPPRSTLFPYTRSSDLGGGGEEFPQQLSQHEPAAGAGEAGNQERSEEHTSELQSQSNLVCRLLLEKKNNLSCPPFDHMRSHRLAATRHKPLLAPSHPPV